MQPIAIEAGTARPLRKDVLRPGSPLAELVYEHDDAPRTLHAAVLDRAGNPLAIGTVMADPHPRDPDGGDWRVRGMATREDVRGQGLGASVLAALERHAREQGARRLWCNARVGARRFYERAGWRAEGEPFEIAGIGPHYVMSKRLG
jgi:GNAT superfamily N-acetyltransferase